MFAFEGIALGYFGQSLCVEQGEVQVEAPQHFHQPLVQQAGGNQDQYPGGAAGQQLLVNNHARLYGFTNTHVICN